MKKSEIERMKDEHFSAGICSVLGLLNAHRADTFIKEAVEQNGKEKVISFARQNGILEFTGIARVFKVMK